MRAGWIVTPAQIRFELYKSKLSILYGFQDKRVWDCGGYADYQQGVRTPPGGQLVFCLGLKHALFAWVSKLLCANVSVLLGMRLGGIVMLLGEKMEVRSWMFAPMSKWLWSGCDFNKLRMCPL